MDPFGSSARCARIVALVLLLVACGREAAVPEADPRGIASLSPAMTTMIVDLGAADRLVGRTPWCRTAGEIPVVGTLEGVDAELLLRVRPSVVALQPSLAGIDPTVTRLQERLGFDLVSGRLDGVGDVLDVVDGLLAVGVGEPGVASAVRADLLATLEAANRTPAANAPRMLVLHSIDPFAAAGRGTYLDEVVRASGGVNALAETGWIELSVEGILAIDPEIVLMVGESPRESDRLRGLGWTRAPRIVQLTHPDALEPSTRIPAVARALQDLLQEVRE